MSLVDINAAAAVPGRAGSIEKPVPLVVQLPSLGKAATEYVAAPAAGRVAGVYAVGSGAGKTEAATVAVAVEGKAVGEMLFPADYKAGITVAPAVIAKHRVAAGQAIAITNDGKGEGTGSVRVTIVIDPCE